jgi:tetratricopeptide (TPR) repeat protein
VQVNEEVVRLYHKLAETDASVTRDLANSLYNLAIVLSEVGHSKDTTQIWQEAVNLYRTLAETDPSVTKALASSLYNLGRHLCTIGSHKDAVQVDKEAIRCYIHAHISGSQPVFLSSAGLDQLLFWSPATGSTGCRLEWLFTQ